MTYLSDTAFFRSDERFAPANRGIIKLAIQGQSTPREPAKAEHAGKHAPPKTDRSGLQGRVKRPCPDQYFTRSRV